MDRQVVDLIELCATPGREPLSGRTFETYVRLVQEQARRQPVRAPLIVDSLRQIRTKTSGFAKPSIRTLVNACALQAISVREMLLNPEEAAALPLLDLWKTY